MGLEPKVFLSFFDMASTTVGPGRAVGLAGLVLAGPGVWPGQLRRAKLGRSQVRGLRFSYGEPTGSGSQHIPHPTSKKN